MFNHTGTMAGGRSGLANALLGVFGLSDVYLLGCTGEAGLHKRELVAGML
jgi:hypothetical protein